jgi:hypothetical protein
MWIYFWTYYNISGRNEKPVFLFTKWDFHLQTKNFVYKTGFSFTNRDSWGTNGILGLLFTKQTIRRNIKINRYRTIYVHCTCLYNIRTYYNLQSKSYPPCSILRKRAWAGHRSSLLFLVKIVLTHMSPIVHINYP